MNNRKSGSVCAHLATALGTAGFVFWMLANPVWPQPAKKPAALAAPAQKAGAFFTYPVNKKTLDNGLDVIVIETPEFKNVLSYNTLVLAGSRNELEKGKTGLAHLFEHILFRHKYNGMLNGYEETIKKLGAHNNAWTWFDVTYYHPLTFTSNLEGATASEDGKSVPVPGILELESSRFAGLAFDKKIFQTEAGAVLGEYRKNSSDPGEKMDEALVALAYPNHSYGHTTMGFYEDILDMPNHYQAAVAFYNTYYRPNNCVLVIAGDVKTSDIMAQVEEYYGKWQRGEISKVPVPPWSQGEKRQHIPWEADVPPRISVTFRMPAYRTGSIETAVGELLPELLASRTAPLYRKLRYEKQTVQDFYLVAGSQYYQSFDPYLLVAQGQLFNELYKKQGKGYFEDVLGDIFGGFEELKSFSARKDATQTLGVLKSKYRNDFLAGLSSPATIAERFAWFYRFERDPQVFDKLIASVDNLTTTDINAFARKYFVADNRIVVTLAHK